MKIIYISICLWALAWVQASAFAAAGEVVYKAKCSTCHDSGAGLAPRLSVAAEWTAREARGRNAMYESAIKGMPATAMAAKGGFMELSDAEVRATVDYMLARVGFRDSLAVVKAAPVAAPAVAGNTGAPVDDATLVGRVAEALKKALAPDARIELYAGEAILRSINIRVGVSGGVVTLSGAPEKSELIPHAQSVTQAVAGVRRVESRLVSAGMLDFD